MKLHNFTDVFKNFTVSLLFFIQSTVVSSKKTTGMVAQDRVWEMSAIPAATEVSLPYAAGITTVFSPRGMAREQTAQTAKVSGKGIRSIAPRNSSGKISRRNTVTK